MTTDDLLLKFTSHIEGKNATVSVYPDRVEWIKPRGVSGGKITAGVMTLGLSTLATGVKSGKTGTEMIPVKSITSITTRRDGFSNTLVSVITSGNTVDFRVAHKEAEQVKVLLTQLIAGNHPTQQQSPPSPPTASTAPAAASSVDIGAQLQQLASLRDAGILSDEEFTTKKAELLSRI
jgi:hypothetical protein